MYSVVGGDGQVYGPVGVETIKEWAAQGRVAGRTNLIDPISGRVLRAEDLDELREVFHPAPPVSSAAAGDPPVIGRTATTATIDQHPFAAPEAPMPRYTLPEHPPLPRQPPLPAPAPSDIAATGAAPRLRPAEPFPAAGVPGVVGPGVVSATQVNVGGAGGPVGSADAGYPTVQVNSVVAVQQHYPPHPGGGVGGYPAHYAQAAQQQHPQPYYGAPQPAYANPPKSKVAAILLALFLGTLGIHRFYLGHTGVGVAQLLISVLSFGLLSPFTFLWSIIDLIMICTGALRDSQNRPLAD